MRLRARQAGQASALIVAGLVALVLGALVLGLVARGGGREVGRSARRIWPRSRARARCTTRMRGCSSPSSPTALAPARAHCHRRRTWHSAGLRRERVRARTAPASRASRSRTPARSRPCASASRCATASRSAPARRGGPRRSRRAPRPSSRRRASSPHRAAATTARSRAPGPPMRPDVARAFDRMERAARAAGVALLITSGFRSDAEQAVLYARHPDPRWVAPPGRSLHRLGTELDLGPPSAYGWLAAAFRALPLHAALRGSRGISATRSTPARRRRAAADGAGGSTLPSFVPAAYAPAIARAAQRWNVSATLLAAQLYAESNFNPFAVSGAGAQGIAQFMPGTAAAMGLRDPFDAERAIDAQAHLMRDLLRRFPPFRSRSPPTTPAPARSPPAGVSPPMPRRRATSPHPRADGRRRHDRVTLARGPVGAARGTPRAPPGKCGAVRQRDGGGRPERTAGQTPEWPRYARLRAVRRSC